MFKNWRVHGRFRVVFDSAQSELSVVVACSFHLILAARGMVGMGSDHPHFAPPLFDAWRPAEVRVMTAVAGYDSDEGHRLGWEDAGVDPARIGRPAPTRGS